MALQSSRTVLIAGSRQGLGRALAGHYVESGHTVLGLSRGPSDLVHQRYRHYLTDVAEEESVQKAFAEIVESGTLPDVVIYSAGVKTSSLAVMMRSSQAADMLRTNLLGAFLVTRHAVRPMMRSGFGRFVYLSSVSVPLAEAGSAMYSASKAGLEQMAFSLSREFASQNITFNALGISLYPSEMLRSHSDKALEKTRAALVKPDDLDLEEIVGAIDFFGSDAARQITGQTIYFGGVR